MASTVLDFSHLRQPTQEYNHHDTCQQHLPLTLDLSLGGLFSKHNGNFHLSLKSSSSPTIDSCNSAEQMGVPSSRVLDSPAQASTNRANGSVDLLRTRSLQAQSRRHEARKRRRSIIDGKLNKRAKAPLEFHKRDELPRSSDAEYVEFLLPGCDEVKDSERLLSSTDEAGKPDARMNCEDSRFREDVFLSCATASGPESRTVDSSSGSVHIMPCASNMVNYIHVLGSDRDVQIGANHVVTSGSHHVSPPSETVQVEYGLLDVGGQQSSLSCTSGYSHLMSCTVPFAASRQRDESDSNFQTTSSAQYFPDSENGYCCQVAMPTCGSSSQRQAEWQVGQMADGKQNSADGDNNEAIDGSCNSSSSDIENECDEDEQNHIIHDPVEIQKRRNKEENHVHVSEQEQTSMTMPGMSMVYAHPFPLMPLPYPYGIPLPAWGFPLPLFMQAGSTHDTFGRAVSAALPMAALNEALATTNPFRGFPNPYHIPGLGFNYITPWLPVGPSSAGICTAPPDNAILPPANLDGGKKLLSDRNGQDITSETVQNALGMLTPSAEADEGLGNVLSSQVQEENLKAKHVTAYEPMPEADTTVSGTHNSSASMQSDKQLEKGSSTTSVVDSTAMALVRPSKGQSKSGLPAPSEKNVVAGRQQSLPVQANETTSFKKKKVVRFNSLGIEAPTPFVVRVNDIEAKCQSADGNRQMTSSKKSLDASLTCNQMYVLKLLPDNMENSHIEMGLAGSRGDARQSPEFTVNDLRIFKGCRAGDGYSADDIIHSDKSITDGKMEKEDVGEAGVSVDSVSCKSEPKDRVRSRFSPANLPRVTTRGLGPKGKIIHGVMYITKDKQARLICVCHGKHMSPLEFVQHSGSSDLSNPERSIILGAFPCVDHEISIPA